MNVLIGIQFSFGLFSGFSSCSFSLTTFLTGTVGGTSGGFAFLNISSRFLNSSLCIFPSLTSGLTGYVFCTE